MEEQQARKGGQERLGHLGEETILGRGKSLLMGQARPGEARTGQRGRGVRVCTCDYDSDSTTTASCELRALGTEGGTERAD